MLKSLTILLKFPFFRSNICPLTTSFYMFECCMSVYIYIPQDDETVTNREIK